VNGEQLALNARTGGRLMDGWHARLGQGVRRRQGHRTDGSGDGQDVAAGMVHEASPFV